MADLEAVVDLANTVGFSIIEFYEGQQKSGLRVEEVAVFTGEGVIVAIAFVGDKDYY